MAGEGRGGVVVSVGPREGGGGGWWGGGGGGVGEGGREGQRG